MNNIVRKFAQSGVISHIRKGHAMFGEAPEMDFRQAMAIQAEIRSAEEYRDAFEAAEAPESVTETEADQKVAEVEKEAQSAGQPVENATEAEG